MHVLCWLSLGLLLGLLPAAAQEPRVWRDPDQGCTYILTPAGGVGLRYRADGTPDCPDRAERPTSRSTVPSPTRAPTADASRRIGSAFHGPGPSVAVPAPGATRSMGAPANPPGTPLDPAVTGSVARLPPADMPQRAVLAFTCKRTEGAARDGMPSTARVQVQPEARLMLVDASGALQRYTLDTDWDLWFNGRSERDPRLGLILSPSRGTMWLDVPARASQRQEVRSLPFVCEPEGGTY
jgi:hypothetical protein